MWHDAPTQRPKRRLPTGIMLWGMPFLLAAGCGVVGDPIAPEDIGIEAKIRAQAEETRSTAEEHPVSQEESDVVLPPLQSIGTQ